MMMIWKTAGSIPDNAIAFVIWRNPSSRNLALGSTQPLAEMNTSNLPRRKVRPEHRTDNLAAICELFVQKKMWEPRCLTSLWASTSYRYRWQVGHKCYLFGAPHTVRKAISYFILQLDLILLGRSLSLSEISFGVELWASNVRCYAQKFGAKLFFYACLRVLVTV
jgi:hypothetical protein